MLSLVKRFVIALLLPFCSFVVYGQSIDISFELNNKKINTDTLFSIYFVYSINEDRVVYQPTIDNDSIIVNKDMNVSKPEIVLRYKDKFYGISYNISEIDQDYKWEFGYNDNPSEASGDVPLILKDHPEKSFDEFIGVFFFRSDPQKEGEGIVKVKGITDLKNYHEEKRMILCPG